MRVVFVLPFLMLAAPAFAAPNDAQCAATFTALSASARSHGMPSGEFDRMAAIAARHAGSDFAGTEDVRDLSLPELQGRVVNCHARYDRSGADTRIAAAN
jgi:hypothetical protein